MRCDECKFWDRDDREQKRAGTLKVRRCARPMQWWDASEWTDEPDPESCSPQQTSTVLIPNSTKPRMEEAVSDWTECNTGEYECHEHSDTELWLRVANSDSDGFLIMSPSQALTLSQRLYSWAAPRFIA